MEVKDEIWKDIKDYEGLYQVSNKGRIRSLVFRNNICSKSKIRIMCPWDNGKGYLIVSLHKQGNRKNFYVHRLVAAAFCDNHNGYNYINHKDYNRKNNDMSNLEWCTQKQNVQYSLERMKHPKKHCKPSNTGFKYIRKRHNRYRLVCRQQGIDRAFKTLEEAVKYRNEVIKWNDAFYAAETEMVTA